MYCQYCGSVIENTSAKFCDGCGKSTEKVVNAVQHWIPIIITTIAWLTFGGLGGDPYLEEVNVFDYITLLMSIVSFASVFFTIPKDRGTLRVISIMLSLFLALMTLSWIIMH